MVNRKRKHEAGAAVAFMSRGRALKKLQLSLSDFRKLCILKGIYPQEPRHPKKAGKGSTAPTTYYLTKDIQFVMHEPIIKKFRQYKIFVRKLKRAVDKKDVHREQRLRNRKPELTLDHIVKERYPTLVDAIRDLDDALSLCFLFSKMPKNKKVHAEQIKLCRRLTVEFMNYVIASRSLRKVFISIKGIYFQVEVMGQIVTWLSPHNVAYTHPVNVDYRIMSTFAQFSCILLGFVNFALYKSLELHYPPQVFTDEDYESEDTTEVCSKHDLATEILASLTTEMRADNYEIIMDKFENDGNSREAMQAEVEKLANLFSKFKFFLNREVDRETFTFVIRACGGEVSWCKTGFPIGATYDCDDESITHQVVDRTNVKNNLLNRQYIQPQWVVDCLNTRTILPTKDYLPGATLPPHLSPFVEEQEGDYIPPEKLKLMDSTIATRSIDTESSDQPEKAKNPSGKRKLTQEKPKPETTVSEGKVLKIRQAQKMMEQKNEERKLAEMAIPKKNKRLYNKIKHLNKKRTQEALTLANKRRAYENNLKKQKTSL
ncbi:hypothetical protein HELRODRAFT_185761 [Helobdella robusta]|uniref:Pescadillo homolog n=1 Tax=Helobdella robusta TaxID=6412 RepID=T1FN92_HELRO|nr:hypothetical protein HELRODRAFT_185761 [Helobdella robusta]ESO00624.1 hypothetical protein HELRODRAFT_185761 [Helobdella robusta]